MRFRLLKRGLVIKHSRLPTKIILEYVQSSSGLWWIVFVILPKLQLIRFYEFWSFLSVIADRFQQKHQTLRFTERGGKGDQHKTSQGTSRDGTPQVHLDIKSRDVCLFHQAKLVGISAKENNWRVSQECVVHTWLVCFTCPVRRSSWICTVDPTAEDISLVIICILCFRKLLVRGKFIAGAVPRAASDKLEGFGRIFGCRTPSLGYGVDAVTRAAFAVGARATSRWRVRMFRDGSPEVDRRGAKWAVAGAVAITEQNILAK